MTQAAALAIALCTWKDCHEPASHHFRWDWGEEGNCCPKCVPLMQQTAGNLGRQVVFTPIQSNSEAPVTLSERTQLIAAKIAAEQELEISQTRGHDLYKQNVDLTQQVQQHVVRARERDAQIEQHAQTIVQLQAKLDKSEKERGALHAENERLKTLAQFAQDPGPSRVGGKSRSKEPPAQDG